MTPFPREAYRPLGRYAPDRRPIELDLSDNTNRWGAHPAALEVLRGAAPEDLARYPSVYADRLRAAVARRFGVPEAAVVTGCGSDDLLDSAFRAAADPGGEVRFVPPTFSMIETFARMNGLRPVPVAHGRAEDDPAALVEGGPDLVYLCRPDNPTGEVRPRGWLEALAAAGGSRGPVVLLDEAYADFAADPVLDTDAAGIARGEWGRTVVLRTFSKAHGLAGLRVGFAVGPHEVVAEIEKSRGPYKVSRPAEAAAVAALEDDAGWVARVTGEVARERELLRKALRARGLRPPPSGGNFLLVPLEARSASETAAVLRERGIAVRPFADLPGLGDAVRVTIGPADEMARFLAAWDEVAP